MPAQGCVEAAPTGETPHETLFMQPRSRFLVESC